MRVYEYAKLNGMTSAEVLEVSAILKIDATAAASGLSEAEVVILDGYFKKLADIAKTGKQLVEATTPEKKPTPKSKQKPKAKASTRKPPHQSKRHSVLFLP